MIVKMYIIVFTSLCAVYELECMWAYMCVGVCVCVQIWKLDGDSKYLPWSLLHTQTHTQTEESVGEDTESMVPTIISEDPRRKKEHTCDFHMHTVACMHMCTWSHAHIYK